MRAFVRRLTLRSAHLPQPWQSLRRKAAAFSHIVPLAGSCVGKRRTRSFPALLASSRALDLHFFKTAYETQANICALGSPQMKTFRFLVEHRLLTRNAVKEERIRRLNSTVPRSLQLRYALPQMYGFGQDAVWFPGPNIQAWGLKLCLPARCLSSCHILPQSSSPVQGLPCTSFLLLIVFLPYPFLVLFQVTPWACCPGLLPALRLVSGGGTMRGFILQLWQLLQEDI